MDLNTTSKTSGSTALRPVTKGSAGRIGRPTQQRRHHTTIGVNGNNHRPYGGEFALDAPSTKVFEPLLNGQARVKASRHMPPLSGPERFNSPALNPMLSTCVGPPGPIFVLRHERREPAPPPLRHRRAGLRACRH